ncbi:hypothetical protein GCM10009785_28010 [Brooklawnia cerclae]|uniref:Uncharacterized protein n=1 Tax=Brooklawnia cerclae TaxID=349934 RepID=A0ABX0SEU6_9ACTN|nr:hypothetical protein [Brooklawnia cerclae]NIH56907.1 hypothetical protein [Brooklawnia cerclae]
MSVLYRALWASKSDSPSEHLARTRQLFSAWAVEESDGHSLEDGTAAVTLTRTRLIDGDEQHYAVERSVSLRAVGDADSPKGFEGTTRETSDGMTWTTLVRVVSSDGTARVWVENQAESDRAIGVRLSVGRPRVVDDLLGASPDAHLGGSRLQIESLSIPADGVPILVEHLRSADRTLPTIVVSQPNSEDGGAWRRRANRVARRVVGVATVMTIDRQAVKAFSHELGQLAAWDGSIRVYAPIPVVDGEGYRHRYTLRNLFDDEASESVQIDRIVYGVCSLSTRRRPDPAFDVFAMPTHAPVDLSEYLSIEDAETIIRDQQVKLDAATGDARAAIEDQEELSRELSMKVGHLDRLHRALEQRSIFDLFYETQHDPGSGVPDEADSVDTAIILAMDYLSDWVVIHDSAPQDLDGINTAPQSTAWGNTIWRGFRALAAFAEARSTGFAGSFYDWCKSDPPMGWPATPKKLSMTESTTVRNNSSLSDKRVLPVSTDVDSAGRVLMLSHLKIAEGGGNLAPRVYFYDDTTGLTKKIHVGFIGPHYLMPNTKS